MTQASDSINKDGGRSGSRAGDGMEGKQGKLKKTEQNASVSSSDAYKIIGNAVPCVLAYNIAKNIESKWNMYFREG